ncbi:integral membrane protein GPR155 [Tympanuchus pallidicinctus]|uniref:integral membrane protein GPR155 n=1 Tax=Tympanuchus pallidicinctus TaxID=109042 RepID=UPI002286F162|nr:integral membrane protein GPR155 [Tympanuchus pallidicinctus]XP_052532200.1 integral membrane protein GPR155 [Tympanuchus pallidicinctus]XP_052532201.1 integral membrane protein GPR155 [Tympanuchus pallidicinctus]XP_052532202.1 integral membrane protein GPR155 [Tympanuchus pallidicinctus]XP_052532203.1 integral membrane protein GPR155 [Tympanuchus pallidicinctus]XP_052532204.1 integral membrane protein GPR155 [Tympanuchus pallidicinctus]XP_052532205.1 integral membrane protein GPR155 [Tymp
MLFFCKKSSKEMDSYSDFSAKNLSSSANMSISLPEQVGLNATDGPPSMSISRLFPALLECFGIILCGYVAGRANIITSTQAKGLGNFVSRFALPALLFKNMVLLNFSDVNWSFLYSILVAKAAVFFIVCVLTLLVASPENRFSKAGLFPIFATQSNDFALGYPIVEALYQTTYPEYLQYIYLVAPISLMMLNPLGFIFCEIQKWRDNRTVSHSKIKIVGLALLRVLQNPIVFMVFIGIASNFILGQKIPDYLENFLDGLGSSFSGSALFYLGLTMVGQTKKLTKGMFVALILLITAKLLMMPFLCREMVELLDKSSSTVNHTSLSNYAFLYGVFPAAPGVAIFATQFNMEVGIITSGMVISTFVSAPIMYVSAWLLTIPSMDPNPLASALQNVSFDISIVSLVSLIWSLIVVLLSKKYKQLPHMITTNLLVAQFIACIGMVIWNFTVKQKDVTVQILVFIFLYSSLYSTYLWTGFLSFSLFLLRKRETVRIPIGFIIIAGWGVPTLLIGILLIVGERNSNSIDSAFFYGKHQIITTAVVLFISILMSGISLMCMNRNRQESNYEVLNPYSPHGQVEGNEGNQVSATVPQPSAGSSAQLSPAQPSAGCSAQLSAERGCCSCQTTNGEIPCAKEGKTVPNTVENKVPSIETADQCVNQCSAQTCVLAQEEQLLQTADKQLARHVLLCLLLVVGLFANLSSCLWWLFNQEPGRLYVELQFFCAVFNFGQGFISFGIFGLDKHLIILPFKRKLELLWGGREAEGRADHTLPEEIRMTCQQFVHYHRDHCVKSIVKGRRCGAKTSTGIFFGCDLVNWLIQVGLASDRGEAVMYGDRLMKGGVIQHITNEFEFRDEYLYYRFVQKRATTAESQ